MSEKQIDYNTDEEISSSEDVGNGKDKVEPSPTVNLPIKRSTPSPSTDNSLSKKESKKSKLNEPSSYKKVPTTITSKELELSSDNVTQVIELSQTTSGINSATSTSHLPTSPNSSPSDSYDSGSTLLKPPSSE